MPSFQRYRALVKGLNMIKKIRNFGLTLAAAATFATGTAPRPASADTASTLTTIAAAAAAIGGVILYNNYQHKRQAANQVVGYTRNGGTIYGDGRIVMPNGQAVYPNANGQYPWGQYTYYNNRFNSNAVSYDTNRSGEYDRTHRHDNGLHRGWNNNNNNGGDMHANRGHGDQGDNHDNHDNHDNGHGHDHG
jgi:hypothetical protein